MPLPTGKVLHNRYRIVKLLGQGGFGAVYRAWDINLNKPCALKENHHLTPEGQRQFFQEASILSNLRHPSLPRVTDFFDDGGRQYLVMDFIEGENLQHALERLGALPVNQALTWIRQISDALIYLHTQSAPVVHRDIKPENIIILPPTQTHPYGQAVLVDFGIAKLQATGRMTGSGARGFGTPSYSPPEQYTFRGTDTRSDVYSLGATLYALLTGQEPTDSINRRAGLILLTPGQINPTIPGYIEKALLKAMHLDPDRRFQTIADFQQALVGDSSFILKPSVFWILISSVVTTITVVAFLVIRSLFPIPQGTETPTFVANTVVTSSIEPTEDHSGGNITNTPKPLGSLYSKSTATVTSSLAPPATATSSFTPTATATPSITPSPSPIPASDSLIAFVSNRSGNPDIYIMDSHGGNLRQLTTSPYDDNVPSWSPGGTEIAFHSNRDGDYEIYIITLSSGRIRQVTSNSCADWSPVWSPDGRRFAFYSDCDGDREIYVIAIDGGNRRQLTYDNTVSWFPSWSPDSRQITFTSYRSGRYTVFVMDADGSNQVGLAPGCISYFSPDGSQILFGQYCNTDDYGAISVMGTNGSDIRVIDDNAGRNAVWSPDGDRILFQSERTGNSEIWIMDADGGNAVQITDHTAKDAAPVWQP